MRTALDLPDELINEAMLITDAKTKNELIKYALQELILREKRARLLNFKGKFDLWIDLDTIRDRK